jgi:hypothetical protein
MTTNHLKPADTMLSTMEAHPAVPNIGLWASNLAYSLDLFRREAECGACSGARDDCRECHGAGVEMPDGDPTGTLMSQADSAAVALEEAIGAVADVVARAQVAIEKRNDSTWQDKIADATITALAALAAVAPELGRVLAAVNALADANEIVDAVDARTIQRNADRLAARAAAATMPAGDAE